MDITSATSYRFARTREDLALNPGERILAGGTWLMSEPQPDVTGFVDITRMDWPDLEVHPGGLRIAATCTIRRFVDFSRDAIDTHEPTWPALAAVTDAAHALLMSFKVWNTATVGGNVCQSFTAAAMVSLLTALDADAIIWTPDGGERRQPVADFVTGQMTNTLAPGEVLRAIEVPASALEAKVSFHKMALAELGRSGIVVVGRRDTDGATTIAVTASTLTPHVFAYDTLPDPDVLATDVRRPDDFFTDALGDADWRREITAVLAERVRRALEEHR
ncbi:FAD binding domain-containing protein [Microbacterium aurantiacum]|uniref:FAD binding domain-containing protein n=1 Tax=Microbacterium aurantiacum TaxID=162393 RepID=A0ABT8FND2_9MICO|nr:FAD binding domain-containing protein [Microbacterium aurantiacum]MBN9202254.1 FAD binding domain-containing protein [Microbacterium chocolatum]MDN4462821.1 FAD binding domain-containing protein [Microbacterium aurantiacum]ODT11314.1 MAG: FAD-binding molybdopterin dehydrogenase [Microbacterium sp. SCN 70-18]